METCGLVNDSESPRSGKHRELETAQIGKCEKAVQSTISAILNFTNPFSLCDKERLYNLASGAPVSAEVEHDVLRAEEVGKKAKEAFIRDRFQNGSREMFFEPIKKQRLKTMKASNKTVKLKSSQGKVNETELLYILHEPYAILHFITVTLFAGNTISGAK